MVNIVAHLLNLVVAELDFEGVVGGCHGLQIPLTLLDADGSLAVTDDTEESERGEDIDAGGHQGLVALNFELVIVNFAVVLDEQRVLVRDVAARSTVSERDVAMEVMEQAALLADASAELVGEESGILLNKLRAVETSVHRH